MHVRLTGAKDPLLNFLNKFGLVLVLIALFVYFSFASPHFLQGRNFINILVATSVIGIISTAMTIAIIGRGPDLTVGAVAAMAGSIQAYLVMINGFPWYVGIAAAVAVGPLVGFLNGLIIVKFNLPPFIVTLAMMNVVRGIAFILTDGMAYFINDPHLVFLGRARLFSDADWGGIPIVILVMLFSFVVFEFITQKTVFGRQIYASGGNRIAARLAGINIDKIGILLFVLSGLMASIAGIAVVGIGGAAMPSLGEAYPLDAITAVLLGGTALAGGSGRVRRTFLGILIIGILNNGMALLNVQTFWQTAAKGAFLLVAIILDSLQHRTKN